MKMITVPPTYSEADQEACDYLMDKLAELDRSYKSAAQPILDDLAAIEARYLPRHVFFPEDTMGTQSDE